MKVAIISDIHANAIALDAVYGDVLFRQADAVLVCGDLIGYYFWPDQVIEKVASDERFMCISGNHEAILKETLESKEASETYKLKYGSGYEFCKRLLSAQQIEWLQGLPQALKVEFDGVSFYCGHGIPGDVNEYLYPDASKKKILDSYSSAKFTLLGHTHYPFIHASDNKYLLNPGSVGQPRDVGGLASYAVVNTSNLAVQFVRVPFDVARVIEAARLNDPDLPYLSEVMCRGRSQ